jgi:hypothetical protein
MAFASMLESLRVMVAPGTPLYRWQPRWWSSLLRGKPLGSVEKEAHYAEDVVVARLDELATQLQRLEQRLPSPSGERDG